MEHIPQNYLEGNLSTKSKVELMELLQRQETLLKKKTFLKTLPDGGKKIQDFVEKLKLMIDKQEQSIELQLATKKNIETSYQRKHVSRVKQESDILTEDNQGQDWNFNAILREEERSVARDNSESQIGVYSSGDKNSLDKLGQAIESMDIGSEGHHLDTAEQYILSFIERTNLNKKREPMKLNRELKISEVKDLPDDFRKPVNNPSKSEKKILNLWEESVVAPSKYKHTTAKEMTLQESMKLQEDQAKRREESQALYAAEKLAEKLNINMETFNPEGKNVFYREPETIDSDDEEGVD